MLLMSRFSIVLFISISDGLCLCVVKVSRVSRVSRMMFSIG